MPGRPGRLIGSPRTKRWTPLKLDSSLLAWWDSSVGVSLATAAVTAWADRKNGITVAQATDAARPTYGATSFNGVPGISFDGTDDRLTVGIPAQIPIGAEPSWIYAVFQQNAVAAGDPTINRYIVQYGTSSASTSRHMRRTVASGVNRLNVISGAGGSNPGVTEATVDLSGRKLAVAKFGATQVAAAVDASADISTAAVPATGAGTFSVGGGTGNTLFANMILRDLIVTAPLSAADEAKLEAFLMARRLL